MFYVSCMNITILTMFDRSNPVTTDPNTATKLFMTIVQALEAETLQGNTANKVAQSAKALVQRTGIDADSILHNMNLSEESMRSIRSYF